MDLRVAQARRALEQRYGLAIEALTDQELDRAIDTAAGAEPLDWQDSSFLNRLVDALPIDESSLFRNEGLWTWLADQAPEWLDGVSARNQPLRALSIGCSAGQEVYSLAMLLVAELRRRGIPSSAASKFVHIRGVDASAARIEVARSGSVAAWSARRVLAWAQPYLQPDPTDTGRLRVDPSVMAVASFAQRNLVDLVQSRHELSGYGLVLCQHVLIYFREDTALEMLRAVAVELDPGATLVVSPVEAHLLPRIPELEPHPHLGAARRRPPPAATAPAVQPPPARPKAPLRPKPRRARSAPPVPVALATASAPPVPPADAVAEGYVRAALRHADEQRPLEALAAARAAWFAQPTHLVARLLVGRFLWSVDRQQARRVLQALSLEVAALAPDTPLPYATELSVAQLASAVKLLLEAHE